MSLKIGIVGLPNVGKSTIFNALVGSKSAVAANYPFCTIDPNIGVVEVPDKRLDKLAEIEHPEKIVPTTVEFVDIAGLVKGASKGEGLGNQFLSHIRECDAIAQVVRCFEDTNIIHVHGNIDPKRDREIVETELILADLQTVEKRLLKAKSDAKSKDKDRMEYAELVQRVNDHLSKGNLASTLDLTHEEKLLIRDLHLLTIKPHLYIVNLHENQIKDFSKAEYKKLLGIEDEEKIIPICARVEEELGDCTKEEALTYLKDMGLEETGLNELISAAYKSLNLITYLTAGPQEVRAWTVEKGASAPEAAGVIHTDFQKGFIKAEVIKYDDFVSCDGELGAKEKGFLKIEGKDYEVQDGDIMHFRFSN
ncbi:MAG: redox-regulated ATPase YchF [Candidatus Gracilibacteria bacterium]